MMMMMMPSHAKPPAKALMLPHVKPCQAMPSLTSPCQDDDDDGDDDDYYYHDYQHYYDL